MRTGDQEESVGEVRTSAGGKARGCRIPATQAYAVSLYILACPIESTGQLGTLRLRCLTPDCMNVRASQDLLPYPHVVGAEAALGNCAVKRTGVLGFCVI